MKDFLFFTLIAHIDDLCIFHSTRIIPTQRRIQQCPMIFPTSVSQPWSTRGCWFNDSTSSNNPKSSHCKKYVINSCEFWESSLKSIILKLIKTGKFEITLFWGQLCSPHCKRFHQKNARCKMQNAKTEDASLGLW